MWQRLDQVRAACAGQFRQTYVRQLLDREAVRTEVEDAPLAEPHALDLECAAALCGLIQGGSCRPTRHGERWTCWLR
jgi:hypothetical protein